MDIGDRTMNSEGQDNNVLFSYVIPCYNCENTLERCVNSILNQKKYNFEIILVDDGSSDSTSQLCDNYSRDNNCIHTVHQENAGLVNAWKRGVQAANAEYILFCDADDYISDDLSEKLTVVLDKSKYDIISFGIISEYDNSASVSMEHKVPDGELRGEELSEIKEHLLFNGKMQSEIFINSRWSKAYKRELLLKCMDSIDGELTFGEDAVTTYATIMAADSIYNISGYYPYHYVRNDQSMIGSYDPIWYDKIKTMRKHLMIHSKQNHIEDLAQIDNFFFSYVLVYSKKEIGRNKNGIKDIVERIKCIRNDADLNEVLANVRIKEYSLATKLFATLFIHKKIRLLVVLTKILIGFGYGKA